MVIFACGMAYLSLVWTLVVIGLQGPALAAAVGGAKDLPWVQNSGTLVSVVIAPPLSRISDAVGRKWIVAVSQLSLLTMPILYLAKRHYPVIGRFAHLEVFSETVL